MFGFETKMIENILNKSGLLEGVNLLLTFAKNHLIFTSNFQGTACSCNRSSKVVRQSFSICLFVDVRGVRWHADSDRAAITHEYPWLQECNPAVSQAGYTVDIVMMSQ